MAGRSYTNFDLLIETTPAGFRARVLQSGAGTGSVEFTLPFAPPELENFILKMGHVRGAYRAGRETDSPEMRAAKDLGEKLFKAVFQGDVYACLRASLERAGQAGLGLRILLRLPPELLNIPWEYLYHPDWNHFFSLSVDTPLVRYLELSPEIRPLPVRAPLRLLVMISSPGNYKPLNVEGEWRDLQAALAPLVAAGALVVERLETASLLALQRTLRRGEYHLFHFIGHGVFDESKQDGVLIFCDPSGLGSPQSGQDLGRLLRDHHSLRLALLNTCEGARTGVEDPFAGVAHSLVQMGLPAVIAMQFAISDAAATLFAGEFYTALADGCSVDAALSEARKCVYADQKNAEWGTPVLFTRTSDGRVFEWGVGQEPPGEKKEESVPPSSSPEKKEEPKSRPAFSIEPRKGNEEKNPPLPPLDKGGEEKRLPFEPVMVRVPSGEFWMGSRKDDQDASSNEKPYHQVYLDEYWIGRYPVTVREFGQFVEQSGYRTTAENAKTEYTWRTPQGEGSSLAGKEDHPAVCVSWEDAQAYCSWLSGVSGRPYGLPTEAQWEKAARGTDGRKYPWGDAQPDKSRCNIEYWFGNGDTTPVGKFSPAGDSPYGCADLSGNVWEWCADWYATNYYQVSPGRNPTGPDSGEDKIVRGGSWHYDGGFARCAVRGAYSRAHFSLDIGFRVLSPCEAPGGGAF